MELELLLGAQSVNLSKIVSVIRLDPGFAAEVVRLSRSYEDQRPLPLETSLIHLGTRTLRRAARIVPVWIQPLSATQIASLRQRLRHTRFVALAAETISAVVGDIAPDSAYLAGLLHDLPALVCLNENCRCTAGEHSALRETWNLPDYLVETMRWHRHPGQAAPEHMQIARRVAAAREWVAELELVSPGALFDLNHRVSSKSLWQHLPYRDEVLRLLGCRMDEWQHCYA